MGIGFTFTAKSKNSSDELDLLGSLAESADCSFEVLQYPENHSVVRLEFCPGGELFLNFKDGNIYCDAQTNIAGPGFHAYAIEFLHVFAAKQNLEFQIEDETDFFAHKDFDRMRKEHFNPWLAKIWTIIRERQTEGESHDWMISWPINTYVPHSIPDSVVTPMGRYRPSDILSRIEKEGIENVAADYFVWPDQDKNARFHRNSALFLMWADCYFMPSSRSPQDAEINDRVLSLLKKAVEKDSTLPFPKRAYRELCTLHENKGMKIDSLADDTLFETIGYRKDTVKHVIGNLLLPLPGSFLYVEEENNGHYD